MLAGKNYAEELFWLYQLNFDSKLGWFSELCYNVIVHILTIEFGRDNHFKLYL